MLLSTLYAPAVCSAALAIALAVAAWTIPQYIQRSLDAGVREAVVWTPHSPPDVDARFRGLETPDSPPDLFEVYLWNITNVAGVRKGAKPRLQEVGPWVYAKHRVKVDVWWDRLERVAVKEWDYHTLLPERSIPVPPHAANITTLNMPLMGVLAALHGLVGPSFHVFLDILLKALAAMSDAQTDAIFTTRSAHDLMWGYEDALLVRLKEVLPADSVPTTRFGLFVNQSSPEEALAQPPQIIYTGAHDLRRTWELEDAGGFREVTSWNCSEHVQGTDAFQFAPGLQPGGSLRIWIYELFRSGIVTFRQELELFGLRLFRYTPDESQLAPDPCYYQRILGLINVTIPIAVGPTGDPANAHGPPVYISSPHYCDCDPALAAAVEGLACDKAKHATFLDIEPITGITMRAAKRIQISSELAPWVVGHVEPSIISSIILPILWASEGSSITPQIAQTFIDSVYRAQHAARIVPLWVGAAAGLALLLAAGLQARVMMLRTRQQQDSTQGPNVPHTINAAGTAGSIGSMSAAHGERAVVGFPSGSEGASGMHSAPADGSGGVCRGPGMYDALDVRADGSSSDTLREALLPPDAAAVEGRGQ